MPTHTPSRAPSIWRRRRQLPSLRPSVVGRSSVDRVGHRSPSISDGQRPTTNDGRRAFDRMIPPTPQDPSITIVMQYAKGPDARSRGQTFEEALSCRRVFAQPNSAAMLPPTSCTARFAGRVVRSQGLNELGGGATCAVILLLVPDAKAAGGDAAVLSQRRTVSHDGLGVPWGSGLSRRSCILFGFRVLRPLQHCKRRVW